MPGLFDIMMKRYGQQPSGEQATTMPSQGSYNFSSPLPKASGGVPGSFMGGMMGMGRRQPSGLVDPGQSASRQFPWGRF